MKGLVAGAAMSLMTYEAACGCGCCRGSELVGNFLSLYAAFVISVLGDEKLEGTRLTEFTDISSNIGAWFAKFTVCINPLLLSVLDCASYALLNLSFFSMVSA